MLMRGGEGDSGTGTRNSPPEDDAGTPLGFEEQELVGGWSRYHSYDGSHQYAIFNGDRTACRWETSSSGSITDESSYAYWELRDNGDGSFSIWWSDGQDDLWALYLYTYAEDEVLFGAANLIASRDATLAECFS